MPVDLSVPNSIIGAYLQGLQIRKQNEARIMQLAQQEKHRQDQIAQFQERLQQEKEEFTLRQQHEKAQRDMQNFQARMALTTAMAATGQPGPGGETREQFDTSEEGVQAFLAGTPKKKTIITGRTPDGQVVEFNLSDYYANLQRRGQEQAAIEGQKAAAIAKARQPFEIDKLTKQAEIVAGATKQRQEFTAEQSALNRAAADARANRANQIRLQVAAMRRGTEDDSNKLLTLDEATRFKVPYGTRRGDVFGKEPAKPLSAKEQEHISGTQGLLDSLTIMQSLGEKTKWSIFGPAASITTGAKSYFGKLSPEEEELKQTVGDFRSSIVLLRSGKAFTKTEEKLVNQFLPELSGSPTRVKVAIKRLSKVLEKAKARMLNPESLTKGGTASVKDALVKEYEEDEE